MAGKLVSINVAAEGGVPKRPIGSTRLLIGGVEGDKQRNLKVHGGPERAVCLYSLERILKLQAEGHPIQPGDVGENLTVDGLDWESITPGAQLTVGSTTLQITTHTIPCNNIAFAFKDGKSKRIGHDFHPGWSRLYAKVLVEGEVKVGDDVTLIS